MSDDPRRHAPATLRNREPIARALAQVLPREGLVLEIASGSGEHARFFADRFPSLRWQPSDVDPEACASIDAYRRSAGRANLLPALALDVTVRPWPVASAAAVLCINMIHIAAWECCVGLFDGAARVLVSGAPLILYGPFARGGGHTGPGNERFDRALRLQNTDWGVRDLDDVERVGQAAGIRLDAVLQMPADNLLVVFRKN